jgi:hypothetical protein
MPTDPITPTLPDDLVVATERTHAAMLDPAMSPLRRHELLVALVARSFTSGRLSQVREDVANRKAVAR